MRLFWLWLMLPLMLVSTSLSTPTQIALLLAGRNTIGAVIEVYQPESAGFRPADVVYVFEFEDEEGELHRGTDEVPFAKADYDTGPVVVRYIPGRPSIARLAMNVKLLYIMPLLAGLGLAVWFGWLIVQDHRFDRSLRREEETLADGLLCTYRGYLDLGWVTFLLYANTLRIREFAAAAIVLLQLIELTPTRRWMRPRLFWTTLGLAVPCLLPALVLLWGEGLLGLPFAIPFLLFSGAAFWYAAKSWRKEEWLVFPIQGGGEVCIPTGYDGFDRFVEQLERQIAINRQTTTAHEAGSDGDQNS